MSLPIRSMRGVPLFVLLALMLVGCGEKKKADAPLPPLLSGVTNMITTPAHFDQALAQAGSILVMVDLYADWCKPCKMLAPTLDEIASERRGTLIVLKVNTDRNPGIARAFGVQGIPHISFVKNKQPVGSLVGLNPKETYLEAIDRYSAQ